MSKDSTAAVKEEKPVSLLEEARAVKEYKSDFENSKKFYEILEKVGNRAAGIGGKIMMKRAQVMRMETDNAEITVRSNPEQAAKNILEIGKMWQELSKMAEEQQAYQGEYRRLKSLADAVNIPESEPHNKPLKLDGSNETRRALA